MTSTGASLGTPTYMSPEQVQGLKSVDARTDVWALGLLLYEMLTAKRPYRDSPWPDVCARVLSDAAGPFVVPGDEVPRELSAIIQRCLERQPAGRYQNVAELAVALAPFGGHSSRISLERIVRVATATGSLAARNWTPAPPAELSPAVSPRDVSRLTPIVPPSERDGFSTKEPVVTSAAAPTPRQKVWIGVALGVAIAASIGSWLMLGSARPAPSEPSLAVQPLPVPASSEPAPLAVEAARTDAASSPSPPPADASRVLAAPRVSVLLTPEGPTGNGPGAPSPASRRVDDAAQPPTRARAPAPTTVPTGAPPTGTVAAGAAPAGTIPASATPTGTPAAGVAPTGAAASEIIRDDSELADPSTPTPSPTPNPPTPSNPPGQRTPAGAPGEATPAPGPPSRPKLPDAWDLSDIDFKATPNPR
jgi:serine/threonine-protein kinase